MRRAEFQAAGWTVVEAVHADLLGPAGLIKRLNVVFAAARPGRK